MHDIRGPAGHAANSSPHLQGKIQEALEALLNLEKQSRLAEDVPCTTRCCLAVVDVCHESGDWKLLNENILLLSKRRAQLKQVRMADRGACSIFITRMHDASFA